MGFFFRKSVNFGPLRFNFSKSGVGVSTGIKGFRVGTGPRGGYVSVGAGGLYYRASLPGQRRSSTAGERRQVTRERPLEFLEAVESGDVAEMVDSTSAEILDYINRQLARPKLARPVLAVSGIVVLLAIFLVKSGPVFLAIFCAGAALSISAYLRDLRDGQVEIIYDLRPEVEPIRERLVRALDEVGQCARVWHIESVTLDGTSSVRKMSGVRVGSLPGIKTSTPIHSIDVGRQTIFFCPDRLMVYDQRRYGAIAYRDLQVKLSTLSFTETDWVPSDAEVTGYRWRYETVAGNPDRRYRDNSQYPVCRYGLLEFSSESGLREWIMLSHTRAANELVLALEEMKRVLPGGLPGK